MGCGILTGLALCPQQHNGHWYFDNGLVTMALLPAAFCPRPSDRWLYVPLAFCPRHYVTESNHPFLNREPLEHSVLKQKTIGTTHFQIGNHWNLQFLYKKTLELPISK